MLEGKAIQQVIAYAEGVGGAITLYNNMVMIQRNSWVNHAFRWMTGATPRIERTIPLRLISGVAIVKPLIFNEFMVIAYAGAPPATGYTIHDAVAENSVLMNFSDNRKFYRLKEELERRLDF